MEVVTNPGRYTTVSLIGADGVTQDVKINYPLSWPPGSKVQYYINGSASQQEFTYTDSFDGQTYRVESRTSGGMNEPFHYRRWRLSNPSQWDAPTKISIYDEAGAKKGLSIEQVADLGVVFAVSIFV